jgi:membrane-bound lytic murein transglycosylase A
LTIAIFESLFLTHWPNADIPWSIRQKYPYPTAFFSQAVIIGSVLVCFATHYTVVKHNKEGWAAKLLGQIWYRTVGASGPFLGTPLSLSHDGKGDRGALGRISLAGLILLPLLLGILTGCHPPPMPEKSSPDFAKIPAAKVLQFSRDDADTDSLNRALNASIKYWQKRDIAIPMQVCGESYRSQELLHSLQKFQELLVQTPADQLMAAVADTFDFCQIRNEQGEPDVLVTGYYQPLFLASRSRSFPFLYPVYRPPADLIQAQVVSDGVTRQVGRIENGRLSPYWTRAEIETNDILEGEELCYLADPVEVFILQVQGSGLVKFEDGSVQQLLFAGTNGRDYRSIGRLLADEGRIPLAEITMPRIRKYLHEHLDERQRILHYNERYVFFRLVEQGLGQGPVGSMGAILTPGRSVALDQESFPVGGLYFLATDRPTETSTSPVSWQPLTRFVLNQDTGAAIKGAGRLDFFWGSGEYPERASGLMKQPGRLYMLMQKRPFDSIQGASDGPVH